MKNKKSAEDETKSNKVRREFILINFFFAFLLFLYLKPEKSPLLILEFIGTQFIPLIYLLLGFIFRQKVKLKLIGVLIWASVLLVSYQQIRVLFD